MTWEDAVVWLRNQPGQEDLVKFCFYDDPLLDAAIRYHESEEWIAVRELLPQNRGAVLDIGAGRGISSFAFAKDGWSATALEPDSSDLVGAGAIRSLVDTSGTMIEVVQEWGESLPFPDATFDVVYGRAVFHHADDLDAFCSEAYRVIRPGGRLILTREHVLTQERDLDAFLESHPLHHLYGGEAAYTLERYLAALEAGGFQNSKVIGTLSSPVNYFPETRKQVAERLSASVKKAWHRRYGRFLSRLRPVRQADVDREARRLEALSNDPGRLYSFVCTR